MKAAYRGGCRARQNLPRERYAYGEPYRHRTVRTKGALSQTTAKPMVFKHVMAAVKTWRRLKGENQLPKVVAGVIFRDGTKVIAHPDHRVA